MLRIRGVAAFAVERDGARRGGERHEQAAARVDAREAAGGAGERVVAAGVEHHDVEPVAGRRHLVDHFGGGHRGAPELVAAADLRADRHDVVLAVHLHAVAGIEEQADPALGLERLAERARRLAHGALVGIGAQDHLEAGRAQRRRHVARVVERIA
jgi:hypothetical protein